MVTIEQKLSMFSKLLQRFMNENIAEEMEKLKNDYEKKLQESKTAVDKEVEIIKKQALKKAESEKVEILSKAAIAIKKEYMSTKEELFSLMLLHLRDEIEQFIASEKYEEYLLALIKELEDANALSKAADIYMTTSDTSKYKERIVDIFFKDNRDKVKFKIAEDKIIGGVVLVDPVANTRIDLSIHTLLEQNKPYMMQIFFGGIAEETDEK